MPTTSVLHILQTIKERGAVSRTDLQHLTGLSWGTITNTTRELLNRNMVREEGASSSRPGRKPVCLKINAKSHTLLGVDLAPDAVRCLAVNLLGEELWNAQLPGAPADRHDVVLERVAQAILKALAEPEIARRICLGLGVAAPGAVDVRHGVLKYVPEFPGWRDVHVRDLLQQRLNIPVRLDHNPNCLAIAERWFGEAGAARDVLCIHLGEGVGMGILIGGEVYRGSEQLAGEFGHVTLDPEGPLCACGDRGCVEAYCSASAVLAHARTLADHGGNGHLTSLDDLLASARRGDAPARQSFERMGRHLGIGVANLIDLFNPDLIVLAGRMTAAKDFFLPALDQQLQRHASKHSNRELLISSLGERATALGACGMVLEAAFAEDILEPQKPIEA